MTAISWPVRKKKSGGNGTKICRLLTSKQSDKKTKHDLDRVVQNFLLSHLISTYFCMSICTLVLVRKDWLCKGLSHRAEARISRTSSATSRDNEFALRIDQLQGACRVKCEGNVPHIKMSFEVTAVHTTLIFRTLDKGKSRTTALRCQSYQESSWWMNVLTHRTPNCPASTFGYDSGKINTRIKFFANNLQTSSILLNWVAECVIEI